MPKKNVEKKVGTVKVAQSEQKANSSDKKPKDGKKNTSLRLDKQTLKALKIHAIENDTSIQKIIEGLIADFLEQQNK